MVSTAVAKRSALDLGNEHKLQFPLLSFFIYTNWAARFYRALTDSYVICVALLLMFPCVSIF